MRLIGVVLTTAVLIACVLVTQARLSRATPAMRSAEQAALHGPPAYELTGAKLGRAVALGRTRRELAVADELMLPAALLVVLATGWVRRLRDAARGISRNRWAQGYSFWLLLLLSLELLSLPVEMWRHRVSLAYGLSVQGWVSWLADQAKLLGVVWLLGGLLVMLLFRVIRASPRRWWVWFWLAGTGVTLAGVFASPYLFDPLFNHFEPLSQADPALVERLEEVVTRGGLSIPPQRMFLMKASEKSTELNAYVTGFGASKRVVVWDTTVRKSSPDEIAFIFAHEMGHYALRHVAMGTAFECLALLPLLLIGYCGLERLLARYGAAWGVGSQQDWAALAVLLLVLASVSVAADPLENGFSRVVEHEADVYGQEAVHGIVGDPQDVGRRSFDVLGEESLSDPTRHPLFERWFGTHPPLWYRAGFAAAYDPWKADAEPKYFGR